MGVVVFAMNKGTKNFATHGIVVNRRYKDIDNSNYTVQIILYVLSGGTGECSYCWHASAGT